MRKPPTVLEHVGPYFGHEPVAAFSAISEEAFAAYSDSTGRENRACDTPRQHLTTRMLYIAETTSVAIRVNVSWALTLPGLSLLRDRFEQVVRFSWLAHQRDSGELMKYLASHEAKQYKLQHSMTPQQSNEMRKLGFDTTGADTPPLTAAQRALLNSWEQMDLLTMAKKRDVLVCDPTGSAPIKETLADLYAPVYRQFSSVSHCDMYALNLLGFHKSPVGDVVLAPDPHWPALACAFNAIFDVIQCWEASVIYFDVRDPSAFSELLERWHKFTQKFTQKFV